MGLKEMRDCNKKKIICLLLAVSMLLSGMCFEKVQADFLLMAETQSETKAIWNNITEMESWLLVPGKVFGKVVQNQENSSRMEIPEGRIFSPEVRTEEIVNRNIAVKSVKSIGKIRQKIGGALLYNCLQKNKSELFLGYSYLERNPQTYSNTVIIRYIHQKDGKKASVYIFG